MKINYLFLEKVVTVGPIGGSTPNSSETGTNQDQLNRELYVAGKAGSMPRVIMKDWQVAYTLGVANKLGY